MHLDILFSKFCHIYEVSDLADGKLFLGAKLYEMYYPEGGGSVDLCNIGILPHTTLQGIMT
jgi:hypothetical protein